MKVLDVKYDREWYAVLVRSCDISSAVSTMLFSDVESAQVYCRVVYEVAENTWDPYMVRRDPGSPLKLNSEGVAYCGWRYELEDGTVLHIHLEQRVVEF
jgi:hypothetical protein